MHSPLQNRRPLSRTRVNGLLKQTLTWARWPHGAEYPVIEEPKGVSVMSRVEQRTFVLARSHFQPIKRGMLRLHDLQTGVYSSSHTTTEPGLRISMTTQPFLVHG
jgi:hypothetical protein